MKINLIIFLIRDEPKQLDGLVLKKFGFSILHNFLLFLKDIPYILWKCYIPIWN